MRQVAIVSFVSIELLDLSGWMKVLRIISLERRFARRRSAFELWPEDED